MKDFITNAGARTQTKLSNLDKENTAIWTSARIEKLLDDFENGLIDIKTIKNSPFKDNDPAWKKGNLLFEYTPEELEEVRRCKADPLYFAMKYAQVMTEEGILPIGPTMRDYQEEIIRAFHVNRFNILMAARQSGKTVTSSVYIAWYLLFHTDKNVLIVANIATTTKEILDKTKSVIENLPFFLKPGCISNNVMSMKFDNGCRMIGRTTTKNTGIGFTINLLYIDEFAHINAAYLDFFYRAIYPVISAAKASKVIITSTPNGLNKFHDIYIEALNGKNSYVPLRVDWWQVPGRDEAWKEMTINNMGSIADFNQEFGLQFYSSDKLLLAAKDLQKISNLKAIYKVPLWTQTPEYLDLLAGFIAHPNFAKLTPDDIRADMQNYIFSVDTADGGGNGDYSVINIFKIVALPFSMLDTVKDFIRNEGDIFGLIQVATYRSNEKNINQFTNALEVLMYKIFNCDKVKIVLELNHKGEWILAALEQNEKFEQNQLIYSKHTLSSANFKPGLKLSENNKSKFCERFKYLVGVNKILPNEARTIKEFGMFGKSTNGTYRSQSGNDDLAMTCVNTASFFESPNFWEIVNELIDTLPKDYVKEVYKRYLDEEYYDNRSMFDHTELRKLNETPGVKKPNELGRFSINRIDEYKDALESFYGKKQ